MHLKIGEKASVVNDSIKGVITKITERTVVLTDEHGFDWEYAFDKVVPFKESHDYKLDDVKLNKEIETKIKSQIAEASHKLKCFEIDLHIEELVDDHRNMTNHEILTKQMLVCKKFVQQAIASGMSKIVLIHGKGEGVLKAEIHSFLNKLKHYNGVYLEYHDASYMEYGFGGATEVCFS